jgi:gliding motility-associated-like protein
MKTFTSFSRHILLVCLLIFSASKLFAQRNFATTQVSGSGGLLCVNCIVTSQAAAVDGNLQTASVLNVTIGLAAQTYQELIFPGAGKVAAGTPVTLKLGSGDNLLDLTALGGISIRPYNGNSPAGAAISAATLVSAASNNNQIQLTLTPTQLYDRVRVTLNGGLVGALSSIYVYDAFYNGPNPLACNASFDELHGISSALLGLGVNVGGVANPQNAIDGDLTTASTLNAGIAALGAYAQQTIIFQSKSIVGDSVRLTLSIPQALIDAGVLANIELSTYNGNASNNDTHSFNDALLRLRLLDLNNNRRKVTITYAPTKVFDRVQLRLGGGIASVLSTLNLFEAERLIPRPVIKVGNVVVSNTGICAGSPVNITASATVAGTTFNWYAAETGGSPIFTGATFSPAVNATTTYYVAAMRPNCTDESERAPITVTVNQIPAAPIITNNNITVCPGSSATFAATAVAGVTVNWYAASTGGTPLFTGNNFTTGALTQTTSYYAEAVAGGTCISPTRTQVTAAISTLPPAPVLAANNVTICDGDVAVLSIGIAGAGNTYNWYTTATGGTPVFTGLNFTTPVLHANTIYYAEAVNATGCPSGTRTQANVTVVPKPADPVLAVNNATINAGQTATINVSNAQTGITYKWFTSAVATTPIFTGNPYTTPALFSTTTYYVAAENNTGCQSANRTAITINVTIDTNSPCTFANTQSSNVNGICVGCTITNNVLAIDADTTTASTITVTAGLLGGYAEQELQFQQPGFSGDTVKVVLRTPVGLADVNLLGQISVALYNGATLVARYPLDNALIKLRLLGGGNRYAVYVPATGNYDRVVVRLNSGVAGLLTSLQVYYTIQQFPKIVFDPAGAEICKGGTATLNITTPANGGTYKWYTTPTGGTAVFTGATFSTAATTNTTYYVEYTRGTCVSPIRYPVDILVNDPPAKPVVMPASAAIFSGQTATFTAQVASNVTVKWYDAPTAGTLVFTGTTFTTPPLSADKTYYAESSIGDCVSVDRTPAPVTVTAVIIPDVAVTPPTQAVNPGTSANLTASSTTPGAVFNWFTTATGGTSIFTGPNFTTPSIFNNTTYYAEASIPATGAVSATRASGAITVNAIGNNPVPCDAAIAQANAVSGTLCVLCGISNAGGSIDGNRDSFSQLNTPVGLLGGYSQQTLRFAGTGRAGDSVVLELGIPGTLASVTLLSQIQLATYNGATYNNDRFALDGSLITINLISGTSRFRIAFKATADFDRVEVRLNSGVAGVLSQLNIYDAAQEVAAPVVAAATVTACAGTQATLTATVPSYVTVKWYTSATGGTPVFTGATFNTPVLTASTTYYAEASRTADGCTQTLRTPVEVNVTPAPAAPVVAVPTVTVCSGSTATFTATAVSGVTFNWYAAATGGTPLSTGNQFTTGPLTATTNYYVEATGAGACGSSTRTQVTANVISTPLVPVVSQTPVQTCSGSSATLNATSTQPGVIFKWYTSATGGTAIFTGPQFTTPNLTANTSYFVEAQAGSCISTTRAQADVTVNPTPAAPTIVITPANATINSGQTATITASSTTAGATFNWYTSANGGTPIFTGATFTTPALSSTTTYYVESVIASSGCTSPTRTQVTITVNPIFSTACDFGSTQTVDINGLCVGCTVTSPTNAVDADTTTASQINVPLSLLGANTSQTIAFSDGGIVGDTIAVKISVPAGSLSAGVLDQIQIASYSGATFNNDRINLSSNLVRIQLLAGGTTAIVKFAPGAAYDRVEIRVNSIVASVLTSLNVFFASKQVEAPVLSASTVNICANNTATFTVANARAGVTYKWYNSPTGGTSIFTGATFNTGALTSTTTYYVEASRTANGCANPNREAATANVTPAPVNPVLAANNVQICAGDNATLTVNNAGGATVNWFDAVTGGNLLFTGTSITVTPVSTMNYYAEITNATCSSPTRTLGVVTVNPRPAKPGVQIANVQVCAGSTATLAVTNPVGGVTYNWYTTATGGAAEFTGANVTTGAITANTTYYAEAADNNSGCTNNGGRTAVNITVNSAITAPTLNATATQVCNGGSATISVNNPVAGLQYNFYTAATGGTPVFTGTSFTINNLTADVSYFVEAAANGCTSATRTQSDITVTPVPTSPVVQAPAGGLSACNGETITLSISNPQADLVYRWYDAPTNGTLLFTGTEFTSPAGTGNVTYYVEAASAGNCNPSARTPVGVTVNALPANPAVTAFNVSVCSGGSATLSVSNPVAGITYNWYDSPAMDNLLFTGSTYITYPVTATTNFYVSAVNASGCSSNNLAQVQVTVSQSPDAPAVANGNSVTACTGSQITLSVANPQTGYTYNWYTVANGGTPAFTGTDFTTGTLNSNTTYYVEAVSDGGCASATRTAVNITVTPPPATPTLSAPQTTVTTGQTATITINNVQSGITYNWYTVATGGTIVFTGNPYTTPPLLATTTYYVEAVGGTCTAPTRGQITITVNAATAPNVTVTPPTRTAQTGQTTTFTASSTTPNATFNWYTAPTGGSPIFTGATFTTPPVTADVIYYADATDPVSGLTSPTRATGTVILGAPPVAPNVTVTPPTRTVQTGQTTTFTASSTTPNATFNWYTAPTGGSPIFTGATFTTPPVTADVIYYADATDPVSGLTSPTRATGTVILGTPPVAPNITVTPPTRIIQTGQTTTFTASSTTPNATFNWYTAPTGGSPIFTGATFTTPPVTADVIYYADATDPVSGLTSPRATGTVILAAPVSPPDVAVTPPTRDVIAGAITTFTASSSTANATFKWYTTPTGGSSIFTGATFTTPAITGNMIFYAESTDPVSGLTSVQRATATVNLLDAGIFIPNAFTPNSDGNNDVLLIYGNNIASATFSVYDQWGELQFRSTNKSSGWDGTYKGRAQPAGVYVYYAEITLNGGQVIKKRGTITLLR